MAYACQPKPEVTAVGDVLRELKSDNITYRHGYQGQFAEKDAETGWNHFELREYDQVIGRWMVPDPMRQYPSPYLSCNNYPINRVDPNGGADDEPGFFSRLWSSAKNWFSNLFSTPSGNDSENLDINDVPKVLKIDQVARKIEVADNIAKTEVSPYVTISVGKQSDTETFPFLKPFSLNGSITFTKYEICLGAGVDATCSPFSYDLPSASLSSGFMAGRNLRSQIPGLGVGYSAGSFLGFEYSRSYNFHSFGASQVGIVLSTSPAWISGNAVWSEPIYTFGDEGGFFRE